MVRIVGDGEQRGLAMLLQVGWYQVVGFQVMKVQIIESQVMEAQVGVEVLGKVDSPPKISGLLLTISALILR